MSLYVRYAPMIIGGGGGASGVQTIGTIDSTTPSANGAVIVGQALIMQSASLTVPGLVNNTTQSFSGNKTFQDNISFATLVSGEVSNGTVLATGSNTERTLASRFGEVVDVMDFGAVGNGIADDTAAIQAAVTYALTLSPVGQVFLPKRHLVTSSINVNRAVDTTSSEFRIFGTGSGSGFLVTNTSSFSIIDSTYVVTDRPLSEFVTFENLEFYASSPVTVVADVISKKFLRVKFFNCYFYQIRCFYTDLYAQTFHFSNCNIRKAPGDGVTSGKAYWFDAPDSWDVFFESCLFEDDNGYIIRTSSSAGSSGSKGCRFINNQAENSDLILSITDSSSFYIAGNYFEGNSVGCIQFNTDTTSNNAAIHSNYFSGGTIGGTNFINYNGVITNISSIGNTAAQGTSASANTLHFGISNVTNFVTIGDAGINQIGAPFTPPSLFGGSTLATQIGTMEANTSTVITRNIDTASSNALTLKTNGTTALSISTAQNSTFSGNVVSTQSVAGATLLQTQNTSTGATSRAISSVSNSTSDINTILTSTGYVGSIITNGQTGTAAYFYTNGSVPMSIGTASSAAINIDTSQNVTMPATLVVTGTIAASNFSGSSTGTNTGDVTLAAFGSSANSSGASLSGQVLTLQPANATNPGGVSTTTQSFAGNKTFTGTIAASNFSGSSSGTNTGDVTLAAFGSTPSSTGASLAGQALTLQPADGTNPGGVSTTTQSFAGNKTFTGATTTFSNVAGTTVQITGDTPIINMQCSNTGFCDINFGDSGTPAEGKIRYSDNVNSMIFSTNSTIALTINSSQNSTFVGTIAASNFSGSSSGTNTGDVTLGAFGSSANSSGASLSGQILTLQPADASNPGGVSTTTQSFAGAKTFTSTIAASNFSGSSSGTNTGDVTLGAFGSTPNSTGASLSGQILTLQPADATNPGHISITTQTIAGAKTFNSALVSASTTQLTGNVGIGGASSAQVQTQATNQTTMTGTGSNSAAGATVTGTGTKFLTELRIGDQITIGGETKTVNGLTSDTSFTIVGTITGANTNVAITRTAMATVGMYYYPNNTFQLGGTRTTIENSASSTNWLFLVGDAATSGSTSTGSNGFSVVNYSGGGTASQPILNLIKSRGNEASPAAVQTSDGLGVINWRAYNAVNLAATCIQFAGVATETHSSTAKGAQIQFKTTPNTTVSLTTALTLDQDQSATFAARIIQTNPITPASAAATGTVGTMAWDTNFIYICTATNTWKRVAIASW